MGHYVVVLLSADLMVYCNTGLILLEVSLLFTSVALNFFRCMHSN